ncbi:hypothetical protein J5N97_017633 [Dioscorea zingiberensis]|uniref:Uncharacterized protein n=1 Tax=Dioscorea zingiberensis TaxID=325984 RepID=A0A9D5CNK3_9LILI|nr:hypothetical protein J5N97_017633 [Dioscorea zingiberensis]
MAKKKNAHSTAAPAAPSSRPRELSDVVKPRDSSQEELENLKTLNHMLLKETVERRGQLADLRSKLDVLSEEHGFMSSIEHQVSSISLSALLLDASSRLDAEAREKGGIKKSLDFKEMKIQQLESKIVCLEEQMEDMATKYQEAVNRARSGLGALEVEKEEAKRRLAEKEHVIEELKVGNSALQKSRKETESKLSREIDVLRRRMAEMANEKEEIGRRLDEREHDIQLLECEKSFLENEKKGMELKLMAEISELEQRMLNNELYFKLVEDEKGEREIKFGEEIDTLKLRMEEMMHYIKQLESAKHAAEEVKKEIEVSFEWKMQGMMVEVDGLNARIVEIGREREALERKLAEKEADVYRLTRNFESVVDSLKGRIGELEHCVRILEGERDGAEVEKRRMETGFELKKRELVAEMDSMKQRIVDLGKDRQVFVRQLAEMDSLRGRVKELEFHVNTLEESRDEMEEEKRRMVLRFESKTQVMVAEMDGLKNRIVEIANERNVFERKLADKEDYVKQLERDGEKIADGLRVQVMELKKSKSETEEVLAKLKAMLEVLQFDYDAEKKNVDALMEDKKLVENKLKDAELKSVRVLAMLKSTAGAMQCREEEKENVVDYEMDEDDRVFAAEMNAIKDAFKCGLAEERAKKKGGLWGWLYPATSTIVAAVSLAYAAKGR